MSGTVKHINLYGGTGAEKYQEIPFFQVDGTLTVDHDFERYPQVMVLDQNLSEVSCEIRHESLSRVLITFSKTTSGKIILT